jgi:hypothetical protein
MPTKKQTMTFSFNPNQGITISILSGPKGAAGQRLRGRVSGNDYEHQPGWGGKDKKDGKRGKRARDRKRK